MQIWIPNHGKGSEYTIYTTFPMKVIAIQILMKKEYVETHGHIRLEGTEQ